MEVVLPFEEFPMLDRTCFHAARFFLFLSRAIHPRPAAMLRDYWLEAYEAKQRKQSETDAELKRLRCDLSRALGHKECAACDCK